VTDEPTEPLLEGSAGGTGGAPQSALLERLQQQIEENTKLAVRTDQLERALSAERETRSQLGTLLEEERKLRKRAEQSLSKAGKGTGPSDVQAELERTRARCEALERQLRTDSIQRQTKSSEREPQTSRFRLRRGQR